MPTLAEINRQINALPDRYVFWTQKEIKMLPKLLNQGETIRAVTSGMMKSATWLAVCTTQRILFVNCGMFFGLRQVQLPLDRIQSIDHSSTLIFGSISVWDGASAFTIDMVLKKSILPFVRATEESMFAMRKAQSKPAAAAASVDVATQLTKLAELKEKGHITDAEFQAQKKKLLG